MRSTLVGDDAAMRVREWVAAGRQFSVEQLAEQGSLFGADVPVVRVVASGVECIVLASVLGESQAAVQVGLRLRFGSDV